MSNPNSNPTREEYIAASEQRLREWFKGCGEAELGGMSWTAIHAELKTMFDVGHKLATDEQRELSMYDHID